MNKNTITKKHKYNDKNFECTNCQSVFKISLLDTCFLNSQEKIDIPVCHYCHVTRTKKETLVDESGNIKSFNKAYTYSLDFLNNNNKTEGDKE